MWLYAVIALAMSCLLWSQEPEEELLERLEDEEEAMTVLDYWDFYRRHPLCLYRATVGELSRLPGITPGIARRLRELVQRFPDVSYAALGDSLALTPEQVWVLQNATTRDCAAPSPYEMSWESFGAFPTVQVSHAGVGEFFQLRGRGEAAWRWIKLGVAWDKDAGEPGVADFVTASAQAEPLPGVRCILGDFRLGVAMGMLLSEGSGFRRPGFVIGAPLQWRTGVRPWVSVREYGFFRGAAVEWESRSRRMRGKLMGWFSRAPRSGSIDSAGRVVSVEVDGIFATPQERARRNNVLEQAYGLAAEAQADAFQVSVGLLGLWYSHELATQSRQQFLGKAGVLVSCAGGWQFEAGEIRGECVQDAQGRWGFHAAARWRWESLSFVVAVRSVPDSFRSPYGAIASRSSSVSNEEGIFVGAQWRRPRQRWSLYGDFSRTPAAPFGMPVPRQAAEVGIRWIGSAEGEAEIWLQGRFRTASEAERTEVGWQLYEEQRFELRGDFVARIVGKWRWRFRGEFRAGRFPEVASAVLGILGVEGGSRRWEGRVWAGIYAVENTAIGFWVYERAASGWPRLRFLAGYGSYAGLWTRWRAADWAELEGSLVVVRQASPVPLWLWGAKAGNHVGVVSLATRLRL
jgi:hypothetical protein